MRRQRILPAKCELGVHVFFSLLRIQQRGWMNVQFVVMSIVDLRCEVSHVSVSAYIPLFILIAVLAVSFSVGG